MADAGPVSLPSLTDLARLAPQPIGSRFVVIDDDCGYTCIGDAPERIRELLEWPAGNVWLPDHVLQRQRRIHPRIQPVVDAASSVLMNPGRVSVDVGPPMTARFLVDAVVLRDAGLLTSESIALVDLIVELRQVGDTILRRAFHLAPTRRRSQGVQLWPSPQP